MDQSQQPQPPRDLSRVPPALRKHVFPRGKSGNPGGRPKRSVACDRAWARWLADRLLRTASEDMAARFHHKRNPNATRYGVQEWLNKQPREQWPTLLEVMFEEAAADNCRNPGALSNVVELGRMVFAESPLSPPKAADTQAAK